MILSDMSHIIASFLNLHLKQRRSPRRWRVVPAVADCWKPTNLMLCYRSICSFLEAVNERVPDRGKYQTYIWPRTLKVFEVRPRAAVVLLHFPANCNYSWGIRNPFTDSRRYISISGGMVAFKFAHARMGCLDAIVGNARQLGARRSCVHDQDPDRSALSTEISNEL
jgi:hypothetical protein